jgi:K+ transporter
MDSPDKQRRVVQHIRLSSISARVDHDVISVSPGIVCFLTDSSSRTPPVFENYLRLLRTVPQTIVFVRIQYARVPFVAREQRLLIKSYGPVYLVAARFGYAENKAKCLSSDVLRLVDELYQLPISDKHCKVTYVLANEMIVLRKSTKRNVCRQWLDQWPLRFYAIQKGLLPSQSMNLRIDAMNTVQIATVAEL